MITHMIQRNELMHQDISSIDFFSNGLAHKPYTHKQRIFSAKVNSHFLPTAQRFHLYNNDESVRCPCCGAPTEDITNMLYCRNPAIKTKREKVISSFE